MWPLLVFSHFLLPWLSLAGFPILVTTHSCHSAILAGTVGALAILLVSPSVPGTVSSGPTTPILLLLSALEDKGSAMERLPWYPWRQWRLERWWGSYRNEPRSSSFKREPVQRSSQASLHASRIHCCVRAEATLSWAVTGNDHIQRGCQVLTGPLSQAFLVPGLPVGLTKIFRGLYCTDREAWRVAVHGVTKRWTRLSNGTELYHLRLFLLNSTSFPLSFQWIGRVLWSEGSLCLPLLLPLCLLSHLFQEIPHSPNSLLVSATWRTWTDATCEEVCVRNTTCDFSAVGREGKMVEGRVVNSALPRATCPWGHGLSGEWSGDSCGPLVSLPPEISPFLGSRAAGHRLPLAVICSCSSPSSL